MGEIDKKGVYIHKIPFSDVPDVNGVVCIKSDNSNLNDYLELKIRRLLRDIYYGDCDEFEL